MVEKILYFSFRIYTWCRIIQIIGSYTIGDSKQFKFKQKIINTLYKISPY